MIRDYFVIQLACYAGKQIAVGTLVIGVIFHANLSFIH